MTTLRFWSLVFAAAACFGFVSPLRAQEQSTPVNPVSTTTSPRVTAMAALDRNVALRLDHVTLEQALDTLTSVTGLQFAYSRQHVPLSHVVTLVSDHITIREALGVLLHDTGLEINVAPSGAVRIAPTGSLVGPPVAFQQGSASITGLVTDSGTGAIITQAVIHVDGTQLTVRTNATGHYAISGLAAGEYRVTARHVGYLAKTRVVTLTDSGTKTMDFELNQPATTLNEVVTTALGDQRRYQVGFVISSINVDSIAPNAPATSVTDLITGRAPGVEVMESSGLVGNGEDIRIRGVSSLLLQSDPIIIVDGIRVDNAAGGNQIGLGYGFISAGTPYRLNDLDINQIASIEILKGPAATTEYGTDGANGVIIITTKRGTSGKAQWNATAEQSASTVPMSYPDMTWNWGHSPSGMATAFTYPDGTGLNGNGGDCPTVIAGGYTVGLGECVVDSTTSFNPLNHAATTIYGSGPSGKYGLGIGGGSDAFRYYFAAGMSSSTGVYKLPDVYRADAVALGYPNSALRPNTLQNGSVRANTDITISPTAHAQVSLSEMSTSTTQPPAASFSYGYTAASDDSLTDYGYGVLYNSGRSAFEVSSPLAGDVGTFASQGTTQWLGGATVTWQPTSWLEGHVTVGIDHETQEYADGTYAQAALLQSGFTDTAGGGTLEQTVGVQNSYTVTASGNATATVWKGLHVITSAGVNYVDIADEANESFGFGLSAASYTIDGANREGTTVSQSDVRSGGLWVGEDLDYGERCYAPLGFRLDVASGYGQNVASAQLPKLSLSCVVLTGRISLRLRGSFGIVDQQPPFGADLGVYYVTTGQAVGDATTSTVYQFSGPGNRSVRPEHDQELEGGFELGLWNERVRLELTMYNKSAHDLLWTENFGLEMQGQYTENVGNARNEGLEGTLNANLIQSRQLVVGVNVNGSVNHNKLLTLAPGLFSTQIKYNEFFAAGYPLYGFWALPISYVDKDKGGELTQSDFTVPSYSTTNFVYAGSSSPIEHVSLAPTIGLWRNMVAINAMFDYNGDFKVANPCINIGPEYNGFCDVGGNSLAQPLWEQALQETETNIFGTTVNEYLDGTYTAFRELSVAVGVPAAWARTLRVRNLSLVGMVRNLALWTRYPYGDPQTATANSFGTKNDASASYTVNNDIRVQSLGTVPLTRQWTIRLNAGF